MYRKTLKKTLMVQAITAALSTTALMGVVSTTAWAQSNTTGTVFGNVGAAANTTVSIESTQTGLRRSATPDASGRYQATGLPPGEYKVSLLRGGAVVGTRNVEVLAGAGAEVSFATGGAQAVESVQVTARRQTIDVSTANSGSTFTAKELAALPLTQSVSAVVQLAPGTTKGDYRYGNNANSFGGAGASENAAYINGFPVTNGLYQVGFSSLPFGSIAQAQILTGGYSAEFGRATGGVINLTTKAGTNDFEVGVGYTFSPNSLRSKEKDIFYPNTKAPENAATDGTLLKYNGSNKRSEQVYNYSIAGPIIKDKLFFYYAGEDTKFQRDATRLTTATATPGVAWLAEHSDAPRSLTKLDWYLTNDHHLEYTGIRDKSMVDDKYYGWSKTTLAHDTKLGGGAYLVNYASGILGLTATGAALSAAQGADVDIFKYTGNLTDNLTLQVLGGTSKTPRLQLPVGYKPGVFPTAAAAANRVPSLDAQGLYTPTSPQGFAAALLTDDAHDQSKAFRMDLEYKWGQHTIRGGIDNIKLKATNGTSAAGGGTWTYLKAADPNAVAANFLTSTAAGGGFGTQGYYVDKVITSGAASPTVNQSAQYVEDRFQVTNNVLLSFGLRNEQFTNKNGDGQVYVEQRHQLAPRLSGTWDVNGDASLKVFGAAGRYHLQIPQNVAIRFAGPSLNTEQFFTYTGIDPVTGAPLGLKAISNVVSANNEFGQGRDPKELASIGLKAHYQDEYSIGFEKALTRTLNTGVRITARKLKSSIDDYSDSSKIGDKLDKMGIDSSYFRDNWGGALFNPGITNTFLVPVSATKKIPITMSWAELGFPEGLKRQYASVEAFLEHPLRDKWYGKMDYTWSREKGNHEGQAKSDNGQADIAFTSTWDFPQVMINNDGYLPNDRTHQLKAFGLYEMTPEWGVSGNLLMASGRPKSKTCNLPDSLDPLGLGLNQYGSIFFVCTDANGKIVASPRGADGRLPWDNRLDLALMYKPSWLTGLLFKIDVLNALNKQTATAVDEGYNVRVAGTRVSPTYGQVLNYTDPRSVRLSVQYYKKF